MSVLEIRDLHVTVETDAGTTPILNGINLTMNTGEDPRHHGPQRFGQVDPGLHDRRSPEVHW